MFRFLRKLIVWLAVAWLLGFGLFMLTLARPAGKDPTDAIVVLTGAKGRIDRGTDLLQARAAKRMLLSGVAPGVTKNDLARTNKAEARLFRCCVDLGFAAVDTRSNAEETAEWMAGRGYQSLRLVTSDWHMARARMEIANAMPDGIIIVTDGVPSEPPVAFLIREYNKYLLRRGALWLGVGK